MLAALRNGQGCPGIRYNEGMATSEDSPLRTLAAALSDVGRIRKNNEDAFLCEPALGLYAVADGMGGHAGGEVASAMAMQSLRKSLAAVPDAGFLAAPTLANRRVVLDFLRKAVLDANAEIFARAQSDPALRGMGCTLDVALVRGRSLFFAHVGDSRIYGLLGGTLYQLTEDHTFGQTLLSGGAMTVEEVQRHPQRNLLMRALGVYPKVDVDTAYLDIAPGDVFLLCSDGVHGLIDTAQIASALSKHAQFASRTLIDAALDAGGRDNATAVVLQVTDCSMCEPIRVGSESVRSVMASASLFADFSTAELLRVQRIAIGRLVKADEVVLQVGQPLTEVYLVIDGAMSVWRDGVQVGWFGPGDPFGAFALHQSDSDVLVRADAPARLLVFPLDPLLELIQSDTAMGVKLARNSLKRVWQRFLQLSTQLARARSRADKSQST